MNRYILNEIIKRAESLSRSISSSAGYSLFSQDVLGLDSIVFKTKSTNEDIEYIAILNNQRDVIVHSDIKKTGEKLIAPGEGLLFNRAADGTEIKEISGPKGYFFEISSPIGFMNKHLGSVVLGINRSVLSTAQAQARRRILLVFAIILFLGIISSVLITAFLTKPIKDLALGVEGLKEGKQGKPLRVYSQDELGKLTQSFNEMTELITLQRDRLSTYAHELEEAYVSTVRVLAAAIDARDSYTLGHSTRVSQLSVQLAREIGLSDKEVEEIEIACLFHDVGKIKIPDSILHKKGMLTPLERREMMLHAEYGSEILRKASSLNKFIPAVRHHHEWYDGSGYPDGLCKEKIPLPAAIISVADAFDAMTSDRPYRSAMSREEALRKLGELSGSQFPPDLVKCFQKIIERQSPAVLCSTSEG